LGTPLPACAVVVNATASKKPAASVAATALILRVVFTVFSSPANRPLRFDGAEHREPRQEDGQNR
jgi:hypothetical protein